MFFVALKSDFYLFIILRKIVLLSVVFLPKQVATLFITPSLFTSHESSALCSLAVVHQMTSPQRLIWCGKGGKKGKKVISNSNLDEVIFPSDTRKTVLSVNISRKVR